MYCTQCGNGVSDPDKFCSRCGEALSGQMAKKTPIVPPKDPAQSSSETWVDSGTDTPGFLKAFANRLALGVWWRTSLALLTLGLIAGFGATVNNSATGAALLLSLLVIFYLIVTAYVPYHTLNSIVGKSIYLTQGVGFAQGVGFGVRSGSVEIHPPPISNNDYIALTWGFLWRLAVVSASIAAPFRLTGYSPDSLEQLLISVILLLLACWLSARWLVFVPYGRCRFRTVLSESNHDDSGQDSGS